MRYLQNRMVVLEPIETRRMSVVLPRKFGSNPNRQVELISKKLLGFGVFRTETAERTLEMK
jgi:hypothetical protein